MFVVPARQEVIYVDVAVFAVNLHVSISVQGNDLATVLVNDLIPHNTFTADLSRSIMSVVAAYGPWSSGYGLPLLDLQVAAPNTSFQVDNEEAVIMVRFSPRIMNETPRPSTI